MWAKAVIGSVVSKAAARRFLFSLLLLHMDLDFLIYVLLSYILIINPEIKPNGKSGV
ncbi:hypothetical protein THF1C08_10226 [Vibrio jasicida]|uniref:Uncharacterized protein n=1 Tax=Vibrio jasicida TaxID=766224 RepID=A0AAU9QDL6_9VIBR|nr:hypothetical protein THF1C08_10226 [Vibrio jasicida]CAH1563988.1 hypothetical protein THF1A12_10226 [Vibrio jasicida]